MNLVGMPNPRLMLCAHQAPAAKRSKVAQDSAGTSDPNAFMQMLVNTKAFQNALLPVPSRSEETDCMPLLLGHASYQLLSAQDHASLQRIAETSYRSQLSDYKALASCFLDEVPKVMPHRLTECQQVVRDMFEVVPGRPLASIDPVQTTSTLKWLMSRTSSGFVTACLHRAIASMLTSDFSLKWTTDTDAEAAGMSSLAVAHCFALMFLALCGLSDPSSSRPDSIALPNSINASNDTILRCAEALFGFLSHAHSRDTLQIKNTFTESVLNDFLSFIDKMAGIADEHLCRVDYECCRKLHGSDELSYRAVKAAREPVYELAPYCSRVILAHWSSPSFDRGSMINRTLLAMEVLIKTQARRCSPGLTCIPRYNTLEKSLRSWLLSDLRIRDHTNEMVSTWTSRKPYSAHFFDHRWLTGSNTFLDALDKIQAFRKICMHQMQESVLHAEVYISLIRKVLYWKRDPTESPRVPEMETLMSGSSASPSGNLQGVSRAACRCLDISVHRQSILQDALDQLWMREQRELQRPIKVKILNEGEEGLDQGGVAQEFFRLAFAEIMDPQYNLFITDESTRLSWFSPSAVEKDHKFELIGLLFGLAVYNGFPLPVNFPCALYAKLLGTFHVDVYYLQEWQDIFRSFMIIMDYADDVEEDIQATYTFSFEAYGRPVVVDMLRTDPDTWNARQAIEEAGTEQELTPVTNDNRCKFVALYIEWLTDISVRRQYQAFERGAKKILTPEILQVLDFPTFKQICEGEPRMSVAELKSVVRYEGYSRNEEYIQDFWAIVETYDDSKIARLLEFVTASDRLPPTGLRDLDFVIQRNSSGPDSMPHAMTCYGHLLLPRYATKQLLEERLEIALANAEGFGLR